MNRERNKLDGGITLIDLFVILIKRKWIFFSVVVASVLGGLLLARVGGGEIPKYHYRTAIEIGDMMVDCSVVPNDTVSNLKAKIEHVYLPSVGPVLKDAISLSVSSPNKSNLLILDSTGEMGMLEKISSFHSSLLSVIRQAEKHHIEKLNAEAVSYTRIIGDTIVSKADRKFRSISFFLVVGAVLGLMLGVICVFLVELFVNVRNEIRVKLKE